MVKNITVIPAQQESDGRNSGKERNTRKSEWQRIAGCLQTKKNSYQVMRTRSVIIRILSIIIRSMNWREYMQMKEYPAQIRKKGKISIV